jgi:5-(carboxyamino)imidazole ribonucleotide mutase
MPPLLALTMGSSSDWDTLQHAAAILDEFGVAYEKHVLSAHRMPDEMFAFAEAAAARGLRAIIAGAGGAAHLPGMLAAKTVVPVLGVPVASKFLQGVDSLYSIAALFAVAMLAHDDAALRERLLAFRLRQTEAARAMTQELK